jgi:hypothetical protein
MSPSSWSVLLLVVEFQLIFIGKDDSRKAEKKGPKGKLKIPLEPIVWAPSGNSFSCLPQKGRGFVVWFTWLRGITMIKKYSYENG